MAGDVRNGILSVERAVAEYGVVISPDGRSLDAAATDAERSARRTERPEPGPASLPTPLAERTPPRS